jgi:tight adherence protein B
MNLALATGVFIVFLCLIEAVYLLIKNRQSPETERMLRQLQVDSETMTVDRAGITMRKRTLSAVPWVNRLLNAVPVMAKLDRLLVQGDAKHPLGVFLMISLLLSFSAFCIVYLMSGKIFPAVGAAGPVAVLPFIRVFIKKSQRMRKFEEQLPDALDLISRSLRAGHALSGALQMVGQEFDQPIGTEFQKTISQVNLGVSVEQALKNMTERVDCVDLKFLTVSIIIQRESGGNLAEILESIARLIRERFKLRGKVRALSAEGRISAAILTGIPFFVAGALLLTNPKYLNVLFTDAIGQVLVVVALLMMGSGIAVVKKMVAIKI